MFYNCRDMQQSKTSSIEVNGDKCSEGELSKQRECEKSQINMENENKQLIMQQKTQKQLSDDAEFDNIFVIHRGTVDPKTLKLKQIIPPKPFNQELLQSKRKSILDNEQILRMRIPNDDIICKQQEKQSLAQSITCPICLMLLQVPYYECQGCMNGFCTICLESWWKKAPNSCAFKCTDGKIQFKQIKRSNTYNALIELLKVKCQFCWGQFTVSEISNHIIKSCPEVLEICRFCNQKLARKIAQQHQKEVCQERPWKCQSCNIEYLVKQKQLHERVCPQKQFNCENEGCEQRIKRKERVQHSRNCEFQNKSCQWCQRQMKLKQYKVHHDTCEKKTVNCNWCSKTFPLLQSNQHQIKCELRKESCRLCHTMVLAIGMQQHKPICMFENLIDMKLKNERLEIENVRLKEKIMILEGIIQQNITNNESKTMRVVTDMRQQEKKYIQKDLLRIDNSIKSVQKLKKQEFASHLRFPHIVQSWCPVCRELEKKFKAMLQPLIDQRKEVLLKISEIERYSYTPKPK